jgi:hypothetical protein
VNTRINVGRQCLSQRLDAATFIRQRDGEPTYDLMRYAKWMETAGELQCQAVLSELEIRRI